MLTSQISSMTIPFGRIAQAAFLSIERLLGSWSSDVKRDRIYSLLFFSVMLGTFSSVANSANLNAHECQIVDQYQMATGQEFYEHFANLAHHVEYCFEARSHCEDVLHKRVEDFYVIFRGYRWIPDERTAQAAQEATVLVLEQILESTGLSPLFTPPPLETSNFVYLVFIDPETVEKDFDPYLMAKESHFPDPKQRKQIATFFETFMKSDVPCVNITSRFDDGILRGAHIWIKTDGSKQQVQQCIAEEFYNSFGLNEGQEVASIFDYGFSHEPDDVSLSPLDILALKLLHFDRIVPGQSKSQTEKIAKEIISTSCRAVE